MDSFAKMDVFFFTTTIAVIILVVIIGVLLYYLIRTARDVSEIVHVVKTETKRFTEGTSMARKRLGTGSIAQKFIAFVQSLAPTRKRTDKHTE